MALTPREFAFADPPTSQAMGLPAQPHGLLFAIDERGQRWTAITEDVAYWRMLAKAEPSARADLPIPAEKFPLMREGWPDDWQ